MATLLEREQAMARLRDALAAAAGSGRVAVVAGEAGIGKTQLVDAFRHELRVPVLHGSCDDLLTPRPLGPFRDMARSASAVFAADLDGGRRLTALHDELRRGVPPRVAVVEDVHWADEASVDMLTYACRRIEEVSALVVLTLRTDELDRTHPVVPLLGRLPASSTVRVELEPLSPDAVTLLADGDAALAARVVAAAGGNPFYVTELLAAHADGAVGEIPPSVREAVLARVATLPIGSRRVLDLLAVSPGRLELPILDACLPDWEADAAAAEQRGIIAMTGGALSFRHELARRAVLDDLPRLVQRPLHERVLAALLARDDVDAARIVHHAEGAGDVDALLVWGPVAAREAADRDSHREAAAHLARLEPHHDRIPTDELAGHLEAFGHECYLLRRGSEAVAAHERALELHRRLGDRLGEARQLRWLAYLAWWLGDPDRGAELAGAARLAAADVDGPAGDVERAEVLEISARLAMLTQRWEDTEALGGQAIELATSLGAHRTLVNALNDVGVARYVGTGRGPGTLERARAVAVEHDLPEELNRVHLNLAFGALTVHDHELWRTTAEAGIAHATEHELLTGLPDLLAIRARLHLERGEWGDAARLLADERIGTEDVHAHVVLETRARLLTRLGDDGADEAVARQVAAALTSGEPYRVGPAAGGAAEHAWLGGDLAAVVPLLRDALALVGRARFDWLVGELAMWLDRAGALTEVPSTSAAPFARILAGDPLGAAAAWAELGAPYERADALLATDAPEHLRTAVALADELGARPLAARIRARLRALGETSIPRGPAATTRENPAGLTDRQLEVATLVAAGLTDAEIAARLVLSVRTVNNHVSAVLLKLGVASRHDAAEIVRGFDLPA